MELQAHWDAMMRQAVPRALRRLRSRAPFAAFVANVDAVKFVSGQEVSRLVSAVPQAARPAQESEVHGSSIASPRDFALALLYCFENGKALELPCYDAAMFDWFSEFFGGPDQLRMGGQAGIIANQLAALGAKATCYCPVLSPAQAKLFDGAVRFPKPDGKRLEFTSAPKAADKGDQTKVNWIFEFGKGDGFECRGRHSACPRANRLIVLSKLVKAEPLFSAKMEPALPALGRKIDRAMIAGFHHLHGARGKSLDFYLERLETQLATLKEANPRLRLHVEYVMIGDRTLAREVYEHVGRPADSLGINEVETRHVLGIFGLKKELSALQKEESALTLYRAAKALARRFDFARVHAHTLGYYVLFVEKRESAMDLQGYTDSLLLAAKASEVRAALGRPPTAADLESPKFSKIGVSQAGLAQFARLADGLKLDGGSRRRLYSEGVAEFRDHYLFLAPTPVSPNPKSTVGLGDTISSTAFVSEP